MLKCLSRISDVREAFLGNEAMKKTQQKKQADEAIDESGA